MADADHERWRADRLRRDGALPAATSDETAAMPAVSAVGLPAEVEYCGYCGAQLLPQFYFCIRCAQPYKNVETTLTPIRPRELTDGERIDLAAPNVAPVFWGYFTVIMTVGILTFVFFGGKEVFGIALAVQTAAVAVTTLVYASIYWKSLAVQFRIFGFANPAAWIGLAALPVLLLVNYGYHWLILRLAGTHMPPVLQARELLGPGPAVFFIAVLPAVMEETAFRGLVQHWLQVALRPSRAILIAACLFTVLHFSIVSAPYLLLVGLLLGWVKYRTRSLYPSMLIHFLHNFLVLEFFRF